MVEHCESRVARVLVVQELSGPGRREMSKSILVVEDNELNMKLFHDLLEAQGYTVLQSRDGMEALKVARAHKPDLILMDIQLPEVSGLEVTKWLKEDEELRSIPKDQRPPEGGLSHIRARACCYLMRPSLNSTCLRTTGSYFFSSSFSVLLRGFFLVT
jgi:two-component system cell cycle response regulator DivK